MSRGRKVFVALTPLFVVFMVYLPNGRKQTQLSHPEELSEKKTIEKLQDADKNDEPTAQGDAERNLAKNPERLSKLLTARRWRHEPLIDSFSLIKMTAEHAADPVGHLSELLEARPEELTHTDNHGLNANDHLSILQTKALQEIQKRKMKELPNVGLLEKTALRLATEGRDLALVREAFRTSMQLTSDPNARYDKLIESREENELFALRDLRKLD